MSSHCTQLCWVHTPFSHGNVLQHDIAMSTCTFVVVKCNVHCVNTNTDGSEASLGVGMVIRTIEKLEGTFGHIILLCVCVYMTLCLCLCVHMCVCIVLVT